MFCMFCGAVRMSQLSVTRPPESVLADVEGVPSPSEGSDCELWICDVCAVRALSLSMYALREGIR